jgi:hypothetical protein
MTSTPRTFCALVALGSITGCIDLNRAGQNMTSNLLGLPTQNVTWEFPPVPQQFPEIEPLNLRVELRIPDELRDAHYIQEVMPGSGTLLTIRLGRALAYHAEMMSDGLFSEVVMPSPPDSVAAGPPSNLVLTPQVVSIERALASRSWETEATTIIIDWTATTLEGDLVWVETVDGTATGSASIKPGAMLRGQALAGQREGVRAQVDAALADLFRRSFEKIAASPELRRIAAPP